LIHECCEMSQTSWSPGCGWPDLASKVAALSAYHTQPDEVGRVAAEAGVGQLVLTHLMPGSDPADLETRARRHYAGPILVGEDLNYLG
ncbi:MAG: hypothetical protein ACREJG_08630, partial [Candidatus Rokuibacteriota bacterium]